MNRAVARSSLMWVALVMTLVSAGCGGEEAIVTTSFRGEVSAQPPLMANGSTLKLQLRRCVDCDPLPFGDVTSSNSSVVKVVGRGEQSVTVRAVRPGKATIEMAGPDSGKWTSWSTSDMRDSGTLQITVREPTRQTLNCSCALPDAYLAPHDVEWESFQLFDANDEQLVGGDLAPVDVEGDGISAVEPEPGGHFAITSAERGTRATLWSTVDDTTLDFAIAGLADANGLELPELEPVAADGFGWVALVRPTVDGIPICSRFDIVARTETPQTCMMWTPGRAELQEEVEGKSDSILIHPQAAGECRVHIEIAREGGREPLEGTLTGQVEAAGTH